MKFEFNKQNNASFHITYRYEAIQEEMNVIYLGLETTQMHWKTNIECMLPRLNSACYVIRCLKHYSTTKTLKMVYHVYLHSALVFGMFLGGNSMDSNIVFFSAKENCEDNIGN
jgi:hypothetical protein